MAINESFDSYYQREYRKLVGLAYVLSGSHCAAEDLVQDALTEAFRKWPKIRHYENPAAWVRRVLVNKSISSRRRQRTETKGLRQLEAQRTVRIEPVERSSEVWEAVRTLPNRQAEAVALFYWEGRSLLEIAEILEISYETAKTHLARGRQALARRLEPNRKSVRLPCDPWNTVQPATSSTRSTNEFEKCPA